MAFVAFLACSSRVASNTLVHGRRLSSRSGHISSSRTSTTAKLWSMRESDGSVEGRVDNEAERFLVEKTPSESKLRLDLSLEDDGQYLGYDGSVRLGKVLEDLDAFACNVAHFHADDNRPETKPLSIVTAACDRIDVVDEIAIDQDYVMEGVISWVGRSSLEVVVQLKNQDRLILESSFLMVGKDPLTGRAAQVNPLIAETEEEKIRFARGEENRQRRKEEASTSLHVVEPNQEEISVVHKFFVNREAYSGADNFIPLHTTELSSVTITQPQEKNTASSIFGGYLMRKAYELARATATVFFNRDKTRQEEEKAPLLLSVDDIVFLKPVKIGSLVHFVATVVYCEGRACQVRVKTVIECLKTGQRDVSNIFHMTFGTKLDHSLQILPETYNESMHYLDGRRRLLASHQVAKELNSALVEMF